MRAPLLLLMGVVSLGQTAILNSAPGGISSSRPQNFQQRPLGPFGPSAVGGPFRPQIPQQTTFSPQIPSAFDPFKPERPTAPGGIVSSFRPPTPQRPGVSPGSAPGGIVSSFRPPTPQRPSGVPPGSAPGGIVSSFRPPRPQAPGGVPPGSAPGGIVSSFRPPTPQAPGGVPPGSAPGGIVSSFRPPTPQAPGGVPPSSAPGGIVSSFRPPRPQAPGGVPPGSAPGGIVSSFRPQPQGPVIPILVDEREGPNADGSYSFNFETGNGIRRYETGTPIQPSGAIVVQGGWSFTYPDGTPAVFSFISDENGYRVVSDLLPTPPPLPAHALAQIEFANQQKGQRPTHTSAHTYGP